MTGILGNGPNAKQKQIAGSLRFQTSQPGSVIPLVYGTARVSPNLIDYQNFMAFAASSSGKGGKGGALTGKGSGTTDYSASIILGVCQGPIVAFGTVWWNKNINALAGLPGISTMNLGADGQAPDPFWVTNNPTHALGYSGTANFTLDNYQLGASASLPNFSVEVYGIEAGTAPNGADALPSQIVIDYLTNPRYGANFPAANLDTAVSLPDYGNYCATAGLWLSPVLDSQTPAQQDLSNIAQLTNSAVVWSGGLLKMIPYGDMPIATAYTTISISGGIGVLDTFVLTFSGAGLVPPITVSYQAQPANVNADTAYYPSVGLGLAQAVNSNATLAAIKVMAGVTPTGIVIADQSGTGTLAIQASVTQQPGSGGSEVFTVNATNDYSWTPVTQPIYSLGEDDYIVQESTVGEYLGVTPGTSALRQGATPVTGGFSDDPLHIVRSSPADAANWYELEVNDRGYSYNAQPITSYDQASIDLYGVRKGSSVKARAIVDTQWTGAVAIQLIKTRGLFYRNTYSWQLGWKYCLLEPMDLVQITDDRLGAEALTVRITSVKEDQEGTLSITAEDWFGEPTLPVLYPAT